MRHICLTFALSLGFAYAQAMPGKVLAECQGKDSQGAQLLVRVQNTPDFGPTLFVMRGGRPETKEGVKLVSNDPRGFLYQGNTAYLLVPNMQSPNRAPGFYTAFLATSAGRTDLVTCVSQP